MVLYMRDDVKASLEINLVNVMSVSSLKFSSSPLDKEVMSSIVEVSSNLLASKGVKEQSESPLLSTMLQFTQQHHTQGNGPLSFSNFINLQQLMNKQYALSNNQTACFAQMH